MKYNGQRETHRERQRKARETHTLKGTGAVTSAGPGRFHGGDPVNGFSRQAQGANSRYMRRYS